MTAPHCFDLFQPRAEQVVISGNFIEYRRRVLFYKIHSLVVKTVGLIEVLLEKVDRDSDERIDFARRFKGDVLEYLKNSHPALLGIW